MPNSERLKLIVYLRIRRSNFHVLKTIVKLIMPSLRIMVFITKLVVKWSVFSSTVTSVRSAHHI